MNEVPFAATLPAERPAGAGGAAARHRRAWRPTSAKVSKHRRVVDDGVDSIIYEDMEEELEASESFERLQEVAFAGVEMPSNCISNSQPRSGTGGYGSVCGSSSRDSISSRSLSRSRQPTSTMQRATVRHIAQRGSRPASAGRGQGSRSGSAGARSRGSSARSDTGVFYEDVTCEEQASSLLSASADAAGQAVRRLAPRPPLERPQPGRSNRGRPQSQLTSWVCAPANVSSLAQPTTTACSPRPPPVLVHRSLQGVVESPLGEGPRASSPPAPARFSRANLLLHEQSIE